MREAPVRCNVTTTPDTALSVRERFKYAFLLRPTATLISIGVIPTGIFALSLGEGASRAFTLIPGGSLVAHAFGLLLVIGGALSVTALARSDVFLELLGQIAIALGAGLYALGVYIGLGLNGLIAGSLSAVIASGAVAKVLAQTRVADELRRHNGNR